MDRTDADVIRDARIEASRFGVIFDRHFEAIFRFVARRLGLDLAEDVAAETFVVAFQRIDSFDLSYSSALPWLYGIASNLIRNHRRSEARRLELIAVVGDQEMASHRQADTDRLVEALGTSAALASALMQLSDEDRDALLLFVWADLPQRDIAKIQGVPEGTVRSRIHRARKVLREHLEASRQEDGEGRRAAIDRQDTGGNEA